MLTCEEWIKQEDKRFGIRGCFIVDKERYEKELVKEREKYEKLAKERERILLD